MTGDPTPLCPRSAYSAHRVWRGRCPLSCLMKGFRAVMRLIQPSVQVAGHWLKHSPRRPTRAYSSPTPRDYVARGTASVLLWSGSPHANPGASSHQSTPEPSGSCRARRHRSSPAPRSAYLCSAKRSKSAISRSRPTLGMLRVEARSTSISRGLLVSGFVLMRRARPLCSVKIKCGRPGWMEFPSPRIWTMMLPEPVAAAVCTMFAVPERGSVAECLQPFD